MSRDQKAAQDLRDGFDRATDAYLDMAFSADLTRSERKDALDHAFAQAILADLFNRRAMAVA